MPPLHPTVKPNPLQKANLCSRLFFCSFGFMNCFSCQAHQGCYRGDSSFHYQSSPAPS